MSTPDAQPNTELVNLTIDGKPVQVPKGTNIIEAARTVGIEIPHYCYHPHLSVPGNCRMCQIKIEGAPKLMIGCHAQVAEGMIVKTHNTSPEVKDAQAATLEFILINHPLDCTVCDQAGHCKLQDYHFDYNARPSRFLEEKEHKVKAVPLGPTVHLDGERCIMCTRCIRFCDEVTETGELGMLNRGDRSVIAVNPGKELNNPLSGTVVDLCPVGALTHSSWRFNTRIWNTRQVDTVCPGCSTGCNVRAAERDGEIVQVKARMNPAVNKEWLCDEGRYGFMRFLPEDRVVKPLVGGVERTLDEAAKFAAGLAGKETLVFLSPDLLLEEYWAAKKFLDTVIKSYQAVIAYRERTLTKVEAVLISPDYAANFRGAEFAGLVSGDLEQGYSAALAAVREGRAGQVLIFGDRGILPADQDRALLLALSKLDGTFGILENGGSELAKSIRAVFPGRSILEKAGLLVNRAQRLQYADRLGEFPAGTQPLWRHLSAIAAAAGSQLVNAQSDRELTLSYLSAEPRLSGLTIAKVKQGGIDLSGYKPGGG